MLAERERSEKRNGAGRKSGQRERSCERTFQETLERERSVEQAAAERERSGKQAKSPFKVRSHTLTIVRECCKVNDASQWENWKFDPLPCQTP